jgi:tetratricopeptide (TPR) repeat protein
MALSASYKSTKENNYKFSDDAIRYSTAALGKIKSGWTFTKKDDKGTPIIGVFQYSYTKDAAIGELTYALAYNNYYGKKDKKTALPLYYELSQMPAYKSDPRVYGTIGDYYIEEGAPIGDEIAKLIADIKTATDEKVKADLDAKVKERIAMFNGYTERALDAYSRAYNVSKAGPYKDSLYKVMQGLYKRRFDKETGLDAYVSTTIAKPFPNPTTPVTPISDPEPTTTTGTAAPTTAAPASTTAAKPATKPMSTTVTTKTSVAKKGTRR